MVEELIPRRRREKRDKDNITIQVQVNGSWRRPLIQMGDS
jgi:hypothetical protein